MLLSLWELGTLTTPAKITRLCFHMGKLPMALPTSQTSQVFWMKTASYVGLPNAVSRV